jgi:hypothetical protein
MQDSEELYAAHYNAHTEADARLKKQQDEHILDCARKLIQAIEESGRKMSFEKNGEVSIPVSFDVYVHSGNKLKVENVLNDWEVKGDYKV